MEGKIKQIGYMPTTLEDEKVNLITEIFELTRVNVIRNLMYTDLTLDVLYKRAKELKELRGDDDATEISDDIVGGNLLWCNPNQKGN